MKSLLLSLLLSGFLMYSLMCLIDPNDRVWVSKLPTSLAYPVLILVGMAYLLALYWGVTGIMQGQRLANGMGILLSLFGVGLFGVSLFLL